MTANNNFLDSKFWDHTVLDADAMLDKVEWIEDELSDIFTKSLDFASLLLQEEEYKQVESGYLAFANKIQGTDGGIATKEELLEELWAGYHPISLLYSRLSWYGEDGKYHYNDTEKWTESDVLKSELELAKKFHERLPSNWLTLSETDGKGAFGRILQTAEARYALDTGRGLTSDQIVVLSGVSKRSVQNALSKKDEGLTADADGVIANSVAITWLGNRRNFVFTELYRPDEIIEENDIDEGDEQDGEEYVYVPVTDDGAVFLPEMRRGSGYQIGKYGDETYYQDYFEALEKLQTMKAPKFRRPNPEGNWGIKVVGHWKRVALDDLKRAVAGIQK